MEWTDEEVLERAAREMLAGRSNCFTLTLDMQQAMEVLSMLQLALRHQGIPHDFRKRTLKVAMTIETELNNLGRATAELCRRGWLTAHDSDGADASSPSGHTDSSTRN